MFVRAAVFLTFVRTAYNFPARRQLHQAIAARALQDFWSRPDMARAHRSASTCSFFALLVFAALVPQTVQAFDVQGHRGARGLAPENTLAAFRAALALGVDTIETDLAVTRDNVVVISHNPRLNADVTRDAEGHFLLTEGSRIRDLTLGELQRYDGGRLNPGSDYARQFPRQRASDGERV